MQRGTSWANSCRTISSGNRPPSARWSVFGVLRIFGAVLAFERGWRISVVEKCFIAAAVVYCLPQLFDLLMHMSGSRTAGAELEGKAAGCAIALFCAPIVGHRLGLE